MWQPLNCLSLTLKVILCDVPSPTAAPAPFGGVSSGSWDDLVSPEAPWGWGARSQEQAESLGSQGGDGDGLGQGCWSRSGFFGIS